MHLFITVGICLLLFSSELVLDTGMRLSYVPVFSFYMIRFCIITADTIYRIVDPNLPFMLISPILVTEHDLHQDVLTKYPATTVLLPKKMCVINFLGFCVSRTDIVLTIMSLDGYRSVIYSKTFYYSSNDQ